MVRSPAKRPDPAAAGAVRLPHKGGGRGQGLRAGDSAPRRRGGGRAESFPRPRSATGPAVRGMAVGVGPRLLAGVESGRIGEALRGDEAFEGRDPVVVVARAVVGLAARAAADRSSSARVPSPLLPGEVALLGEGDREGRTPAPATVRRTPGPSSSRGSGGGSASSRSASSAGAAGRGARSGRSDRLKIVLPEVGEDGVSRRGPLSSHRSRAAKRTV